MKTRPLLVRGDLVMLNKSRMAFGLNKRQVYKVVGFPRMPRSEKRKLGNPNLMTSDGVTYVRIIDSSGFKSLVRRRDLWKLPNQPRHKRT